MQRAIDRLEPFQKAIAKAHLAAAGADLDALDSKPLIAVANSGNEICPGHESLSKLAADVKKGILEAGGEPFEFSTIGMCDGIAQGHAGMRYCLPHRELITDSIEAMIKGEGVFDGVVMMGSCDKILPGMLNAAARVNLPAIFVTAGPCYAEITPDESKRARQRFLRGEISERELIETTLHYYTGSGVCPFLGTANTMACLCEALGMMLPDGSLIPSGTSLRRLHARASGRAIMELVKRGITPDRILNQNALENALTLLSAISGSLNALIHLPALAGELNCHIDWEDISRISGATPVLTRIVPNGNRTVIDLYKAGGVRAVMKELLPLLHQDSLTVTGKTVLENLSCSADGDRAVIRPLSDPFMAADGIQVLRGNIAPDGALVKTSAVPDDLRVFRGSARVFESEEACYAAFRAKAVKANDALIIRNVGPKGAPGMPEMHRVTEMLRGIPGTAVITDGRFSGASGGLSIGCVCPEAAEGGPIALIEDGDIVKADLRSGTINIEVPDDEMNRRRMERKWTVGMAEKGYLARYAASVCSAKEGATLRRRPPTYCTADSDILDALESGGKAIAAITATAFAE